MEKSAENRRNRNILMAVTLFFWYAQYVYVPYQTPYLTGLGITATVVGIILGCYGFSQMIIRIPLGIASDRHPRHKLMIAVGAACAGSASLLRFMSDSGTAFLAANLISGFASATYISFTVLNTTYYDSSDIKKAMGTITAFNNAGILIAFITGMIVSQLIGVKVLFWLSCFAGAAAFIVSLFIKSESRPVSGLSVRELLKTLRSSRLIIFGILALIVQMIHMSTAMAFTTQVAKDIGGSNLEIGLVSVIYMILGVISAYFAGTKTAARIGGRALMVMCFAFFVVYCILIPLMTDLMPIYFLQALGGFANGMLFSLCMSEAITGIAPERKSSAMGFFQAVYGVGMTIGPMIVGSVRDAAGMTAGYLFLVPFACAGIVIALLAYGRKAAGKLG